MKKLFYIFLPFLIIGFFMVSCQLSSPNDTVLTNHSSRTVTVNLIGTGEIVLAPGESRAIETRTDMNPSSRMRGFSPEKRVLIRYTNTRLLFEFYNRQSREVRVFNISGYAGVLSADGWMDEIGFTALAHEQTHTAWRVYHSNPTFTAVTSPVPYDAPPIPGGFPLSVDMLFVEAGNYFRVTIGN